MKIKFLFLTLITIFLCVNIFSQPVIGKQKTIGGKDYDELTCLALTNDGGFIAGGHSSSNISLDKTDSSRGLSDYWIVKLDSSGNIQWDKTIGGRRTEIFQSIEQTTDGGYILGGYSQSNVSGEKTEKSKGSYDYWIVKLDASGAIQWDKTIGSDGEDHLLSVKQTSDGGYIAGGISYSNISGDKTENSRGQYDYWVVKLNASGSIEWDKTIGGIFSDLLYSIIETTDKGYLLGGQSDSPVSGEKTQNSKGAQDFWIVKLDASGNKLWDKTIGGSAADGLQYLQQTLDGGYILGGYSWSNISGDKSQRSRGASDYWVVKTDSIGNIQWDRTLGSSGNDGLSSIDQTTDSGYILAGVSNSGISGEKTEDNRGVDDYWIVKLNKQGKFVWDKTIGGDAYDYPATIKERKKNQYIIGGYSSSNKTGDKKTNSAKDDFWIIELKFSIVNNVLPNLSEVNSVILNKTNRGNFSAYPNPAKNILHIQNSKNTTFSLVNQSGKTILTKTISGNGEMNVAQLPAGLYYLKNNETGVVQKIIITK